MDAQDSAGSVDLQCDRALSIYAEFKAHIAYRDVHCIDRAMDALVDRLLAECPDCFEQRAEVYGWLLEQSDV